MNSNLVDRLNRANLLAHLETMLDKLRSGVLADDHRAWLEKLLWIISFVESKNSTVGLTHEQLYLRRALLNAYTEDCRTDSFSVIEDKWKRVCSLRFVEDVPTLTWLLRLLRTHLVRQSASESRAL